MVHILTCIFRFTGWQLMGGRSCYIVCLSMAMMWMLRYGLDFALVYTVSHLIAHTVNCQLCRNQNRYLVRSECEW